VAWKFLLVSGGALLLGIGVGLVHADELPLQRSIEAEISAAYPGAAIELHGELQCLRGVLPTSMSSVKYLGENGRGEAQLQIRGVTDAGDVATIAVCEGMVPFSAMMPALVAIRRVSPGEKIDPANFMRKSVDVARGQAREMRGLIYPESDPLEGVEARQTILEGQFLTSPAIQRMPDVRKGDAVSIRILTGDLTLTVRGTAEEPAYLDGRVKVLSGKTKRELVGLLRQGSIVEVKL
jgi:flagella basal body P-ring formation protein FlgA